MIRGSLMTLESDLEYGLVHLVFLCIAVVSDAMYDVSRIGYNDDLGICTSVTTTFRGDRQSSQVDFRFSFDVSVLAAALTASSSVASSNCSGSAFCSKGL